MSAADITWDDVVAIGPELVKVPAAAQTAILLFVNKRVNVSLFPDETGDGAFATYTLVRSYLAAHLGASTLLKGRAGPVTNESVGGMNRSYANLSASPLWDITSYGRMFRTLVWMAPGCITGMVG